MKSNAKLVVLPIILVSLIWGYLWVTIKIGLDEIPPLFFTSLRLIIGGVVLVVVQLIRRKEIWPRKKEWKPFIILSLFMCVGYYALSTYGMQYVSSGISSVLVYTMPIIVTVLAHYFLAEHLTLNKIIGLIAGLIGLIFVIGDQIFHLSWNASLLGEIIILVSAFFWACTNLYTKKVGHAHDKIKMTIWQISIGGIITLIISLVTEPTEISNIHLTTPAMLALLYNGILGSAVAFVTWNWILSKIDASVASITLMSVPLLGLFFGWLQLNEKISSNVLIGAIFICIGILFSSIKSRKKTSANQPISTEISA